jgi:phage shock protein E
MLKTIPTLIAEIRKNIQTTSAHDAYLSEQKEKSLFIDIREAQEVATSPVINSVNIPRGVLEMNIGNCTTDKNQRISSLCNWRPGESCC